MAKRKAIQIKERIVDVPMTINQVYWGQYKKMIAAEIEKGEALTHKELVLCLLGESEDYWRGLTDVQEYIYLSGLLYKIYLLIKSRPQRKALREVIISEYVKPKKRKWWRRKKSVDNLAKNEIQVDDKTYYAPEDLRWNSTGQYQDALEVTAVIHSKTAATHLMEAYERLFKIYFYPIVTGKEYNPEDALSWNVDLARFMDVVDFGSFFLFRLNRYQNGILTKLPKLITPLKK